MKRITIAVLIFTPLAFAATQNGLVRSEGRPIPGATVTAICGTDKILTVTDDSGHFTMGGLPEAPCKFSVLMFGFEPIDHETAASGDSLDFDLKLQQRASLPTEPAPAPSEAAAPAPAAASPSGVPPGPGRGGPGRGGVARGGNGPGRPGGSGTAAPPQGQNRGFQNLSLVQNGENPEDTGEVFGGAPDDASGSNEAFLVNGSLSQGVQAQPGDNVPVGGPAAFGAGTPAGPGGAGNPFANTTATANGTPSLAEAQTANGPGGFGGQGGGGFGGPGGGRGGGGFGGGGRGGGRAGARGGRPPNRNTQFGNRINRGRGRQFQGSAYYTVGNSVANARPYSFTSPTTLGGEELPKAAYAANRFGISMGGPLYIPHLISGDKTFWFINYTGNRSKNGFDYVSTVPTAAERMGNFSALGTAINFPNTTTPFPNNVIPASMLNSVAAGLLQYIPMPNAPGLRNNYQLIGANPSNNDNLQARINQTISAKDGLDVNFNYQRRDSETIQRFGFADPTSGYGVSGSLTYRRTISRTLINSLAWSFSRNLNYTLSAFSYGTNVTGDLGINGVFPTPAQYGPPTIQFTNFQTLSDGTPSSTRLQNSTVTESLIQIHGKQTVTYGVSFQRRQNNITSNPNARGTFNFTGIATGYDFSDFLLGLPYQTSAVTYLDNNEARYLRESVVSAFVTDDYRVKSNFTINAGLRWEYFQPYTEKYNQISNLDFAPGFTGVAQVLPGQTGPYSGAFPNGFIKPDYKLFSPRIGIAWKPWKSKQVVIRSGYGIYYNGSVYGTLASRVVGQPPFATTTQLFQSSANPLTLENGFPATPSDEVGNTFTVDKNYRPGYAQNWTTSIQQTFGRSYVFTIAYNGIKGTDLDVLQLPNRAPLGTPQLQVQSSLMIPYANQFLYDNSIGNSSYNALQLQLQRRFARGRSFAILYTFSKAIDDSSTLGGGPVLIPNDIGLERALSPTDQRHTLRVNYNFQSPISNMRTGVTADLLRGWTVAGGLNFTSGLPFTATVNGDPSGTGYTGAARADATGVPVSGDSGYFNAAAFAVPLTGTFGTAGRDTIPGIPNFTLTASLFRSFRLDEKRRIEFRIDTMNPINHVNVTAINTTVGSLQYGLPVTAGGMRTMTATVRLRF